MGLTERNIVAELLEERYQDSEKQRFFIVTASVAFEEESSTSEINIKTAKNTTPATLPSLKKKVLLIGFGIVFRN